VASLRLNFSERVSQIEDAARLVAEAANQIKHSKKLAKVLEYVLALGNHLNRGTTRGGYSPAARQLNVRLS